MTEPLLKQICDLHADKDKLLAENAQLLNALSALVSHDYATNYREGLDHCLELQHADAVVKAMKEKE